MLLFNLKEPNSKAQLEMMFKSRENKNLNLYRADGQNQLLEVGLGDGLRSGEDQLDDAVGGGVGTSAEHLQVQASEAHRLKSLNKVPRLLPNWQCFGRDR